MKTEHGNLSTELSNFCDEFLLVKGMIDAVSCGAGNCSLTDSVVCDALAGTSNYLSDIIERLDKTSTEVVEVTA